jgi:hypothetical protein
MYFNSRTGSCRLHDIAELHQLAARRERGDACFTALQRDRFYLIAGEFYSVDNGRQKFAVDPCVKPILIQNSRSIDAALKSFLGKRLVCKTPRLAQKTLKSLILNREDEVLVHWASRIYEDWKRGNFNQWKQRIEKFDRKQRRNGKNDPRLFLMKVIYNKYYSGIGGAGVPKTARQCNLKLRKFHAEYDTNKCEGCKKHYLFIFFLFLPHFPNFQVPGCRVTGRVFGRNFFGLGEDRKMIRSVKRPTTLEWCESM